MQYQIFHHGLGEGKTKPRYIRITLGITHGSEPVKDEVSYNMCFKYHLIYFAESLNKCLHFLTIEELIRNI